MKKLISVLILALIVSGCTGMPDIFNIFGGGQKVKEMPEDVIIIKDLTVLPPTTVYSGDQFSVSFSLENLEEEKDISVGYRLLDDGLCVLDASTGGFCSGGEQCYPLSKESCSSICPKKDSSECCWDYYGETFADFIPGQEEFVEWTFGTPTNEQMGSLGIKCPIRFIVGYTYTAASEIEVDVISDVRYDYLKQSGEFTTFTPTLTVGRGPVKIYMDLGASLPIRAGRVLPVYITVEDKGSGLLEKILEEKLTIEAPGFTNLDCQERFDCSGNSCLNNQEIVIINKKSPTIKCSFTTSTDIQLEQTNFVDAYMDYYYTIIKDTDIDVKPSPA